MLMAKLSCKSTTFLVPCKILMVQVARENTNGQIATQS